MAYPDLGQMHGNEKDLGSISSSMIIFSGKGNLFRYDKVEDKNELVDEDLYFEII